MKHILDLPRRFDDWCLARTADGLVLLHEWLDLDKPDVIRVGTVSVMGFAAVRTIRDHDWVLLSIWLLCCSMEWFSAPSSEQGGHSAIWQRCWRLGYMWPLAILNGVFKHFVSCGLWSSIVALDYIKHAPKPPSDRGRRRKELLAKLKFRKFEPVPQT